MKIKKITTVCLGLCLSCGVFVNTNFIVANNTTPDSFIEEGEQEGDINDNTTFDLKNNAYPTLLEADWENASLNLPGMLSLNFTGENGKDGSGIRSITPIFDQSIKDLPMHTGGNIYDGNKGAMQYTVNEYIGTDSLKTYGFMVVDTLNNTIYYLCNPDDIDAYDNYYGTHIDQNATIVKWDKPIKTIEMKKAITYQAILTNNEDALKVLEKANEGETYVMDIHQNKIIDKRIFESIQGKNITLVFDDVTNNDYFSQKIQWSIKGSDIKEPKTIDVSVEATLCNLKIDPEAGSFGFQGMDATLPLYQQNLEMKKMIDSQDVLSYYSEYLNQLDINKDSFVEKFWEEYQNNEYVKFTFKPNGELPGNMQIRFKNELAFKNHLPIKNLNLYYVNGSSMDLSNTDIYMDEVGYYTFTITHNSQYMLTKIDYTKEEKDPSPQEPTTPQPDESANEINGVSKDKDSVNKKNVNTGDHENRFIFYAMSILSGFAMLFVIIRKVSIRKS